ncbi:MAG: SpoIIE family protein phosphatase [Bacteroidota bacterium]
MPMPDLRDSSRTDRLDLRAVYETSGFLTSLDLDFVLNNLLLVAMSKLLTTRGALLLDEHRTAHTDRDYRVAAAKGMARDVNGLIAGQTVHLDAPDGAAWVGDAVPLPLREAGLHLALPLRYKDDVIGLLGLGKRARGGDYEAGEVAFVRSLVNMAAPAVHNARVAEELETANHNLAARVQELNTLFELSQTFGRTLDRDEAVKLLSFTLLGQLLAKRHLILVRNETGQLICAIERGGTTDLPADLLARLSTLHAPVFLDEHCAKDWVALREAGFRVLVPIGGRDVTRGVFALTHATNRPYTDREVEFVTSLGTLAFTSLENAELVEARVEKERLEEEMRLARTIQERLLPTAPPTSDELDIATLALPSRHVAGDYFDLIPLDDGTLLVAIADVSGKGMPASLLMANLQACLQVLRGSGLDLASATARINRVVHGNTGAASFITFFWGIYDPATGRFDYVNAGHNPPMLLRTDGTLDLLEDGGLILGVLADFTYDEGTTTLAPGDVLALFTDGVTEAHGLTLDGEHTEAEDYGEDRLEAVLRTHQTASATTILDALHADVRTYTDDAPLSDDLTALVLKRG